MRNHLGINCQPNEQLVNGETSSIWVDNTCNIHAILMEGIPEKYRGQLTNSDQHMHAGNTRFPPPEDSIELLHHVYEAAMASPPGVARASVFMTGFIFTHPFVDGNGCMGRLIANAELQRAGLSRFIMHFDARDQYVDVAQQWYRYGNAQNPAYCVAQMQYWTQSYRWHPDILTAQQRLEEDHFFMSKKCANRSHRESQILPHVPAHKHGIAGDNE